MSETTVVAKKRKRAITSKILVEVVVEDDVVTFRALPAPPNIKTENREGILKAVQKAAERGDTRYDGKEITVISYQPAVTLVAVPQRKVVFE